MKEKHWPHQYEGDTRIIINRLDRQQVGENSGRMKEKSRIEK